MKYPGLGARLSFNDEGWGGALPNGGVTYDYEVNGVATNAGVPANTTVNLFVVKFELSATPGGMVVSGTNLTFDNIRIADYAAKWDEIRWGITFNDVTTTAPAVVFDVPGLSVADTYLVQTLQGLVNRSGPRLMFGASNTYAGSYVQDSTWNAESRAVHEQEQGLRFR